MLLQNVSKTQSKSYTKYTKETVQQYIRAPYKNQNNLRQVSQFLERISMPYRKIIEYYSLMPLYHYNITYNGDFNKGYNNKFKKNYYTLCSRLQNINMKKIFSTVIAAALRDGVYYGFVNDSEKEGFFLQALDPKYCKICGETNYGTYAFKMDVSYFDSGNNKEYLYGINNNGENTWDSIFKDGYEQSKSNGTDSKWFLIPPEKSICIIAGDDPILPLPYFIPIFNSLLNLLDLEYILQSRTELENYILLVSKIPLLKNAKIADEFAVSGEYIEFMQELLESACPDLCTTAYTACEIEKITFERSNTTQDTDTLAQSFSNLMSNVGISEMLFSGKSTNSIGLKHSITVDEALSFKLLSRIENWMQAYIKLNIVEDFTFNFHRITYFNQDEYINKMKDGATLGGSALDYFTAKGSTPFEVQNKLLMEESLNFKSKLQPLSTSYTQSSKSPGAPKKPEEELSDEGQSTRDGNKNGTEIL